MNEKKNYIIVFILVFLFYNTDKLFSIIPEGLYITPKFVFSHDGNIAYNIKTDTNYLGGGFALGLHIPSINKSSPIRFEFEYLARKSVVNYNNLTMHTILGSIYFDLNFFMIKEQLTDETYRKTLLNQYPPFTIYFGISIGGRINNRLESKSKLIYSESTVVFAFSGGMAFNVLPFMSVDIGYRYLLDTKAAGYHEALIGLRFKFPKL